MRLSRVQKMSTAAASSAMVNSIAVEVVYIIPQEQVIINLQVPLGSTIEQVINYSGLLQRFPDIDLATGKVGVFNEIRALMDKVEAGDRIEIYRPLQADPKQARRRRAEKKTSRQA